MFQLLACLLLSLTLQFLHAKELSVADAACIGKQIFFNECSEKKEKLVWWNEGEQFASLGIGHFIWYPTNKIGPFKETFPELLAFFKEKHISLPNWLSTASGCPWQTREDFFAEKNRAQHNQLQELLLRTIPLQTQFIYQQFQTALEQILSAVEKEKKQHVLTQIKTLQASASGTFALIDYLNFKGAGTSAREEYEGHRWGLKQVLEEMPAHSEEALSAFIETAKNLLTLRVAKAPPERQEKRWLAGWISRIERYKTYKSNAN